MAKKKRMITKEQLDDYIIECKVFKGQFADYIHQEEKKSKGLGAGQTLEFTEPPKGPKNPPGTP